MSQTTTPTLGPIKRSSGIAGQFSLTVEVSYPGESEGRKVTFVGSTYGGPVVMVTGSSLVTVETFVTDPGRFGAFGPQWVRRFYGVEEY